MDRRTVTVVVAATIWLAAACEDGLRTVAAEPDGPPGIVLATPAPADRVQLDAADAFGEQGRGPYADTWGTLAVDVAHGRLLLHATSPGRAGALVRAARGAHPEIAGVEVRILPCEYTERDELAAVERILAAQRAVPFPHPVHIAGPTTDGTGVLVGTSAEALGSAEFVRRVRAAAGAVPVRLEVGARPVAAAAIG